MKEGSINVNLTVIFGNDNAIRPPCDAARRHADLAAEHTQTVDLLEMQDELIAELRANLLTAATLACTLVQQVIHAGQRPDCEPEALALCDAVIQEQHDCEWSRQCGSACGVDEGE